MTNSERIEDAREAAESAQHAAETTADLVREQAEGADEAVARGVTAAMQQQSLQSAAAELERGGDWRTVSVEPGRITLTGAPPINWWVHGILPFFTAFLSLIWTAKVAKKPRGTLTLTIDHLGRVQQTLIK